MKVPRFGIWCLIVLVAIAALNFGVIRIWYQVSLNGQSVKNWVEVLTYGTLPMANFLAVGIMIGFSHPAVRPFLWGFEVFGVISIAFFMTLAFFYTEDVVQPFVLWFLRLRFLRTFTDMFRPTVQIPMFYSIATLVVGLPQLTFALIGGFMSQWLRFGRLPDGTRG